jgi:hypothetical protein
LQLLAIFGDWQHEYLLVDRCIKRLCLCLSIEQGEDGEYKKGLNKDEMRATFHEAFLMSKCGSF